MLMSFALFIPPLFPFSFSLYPLLPNLPPSSSEGDSKVIKSVDRILSIWEERNVYTEALITELRGYLVKEETPPETPVEIKSKDSSFCSHYLSPMVLIRARPIWESDFDIWEFKFLITDICSSYFCFLRQYEK